MVIFTYAPAGLGHLRVTDALYHGLPKGVTPVILGSQDDFVRVAHRISSIHPWARAAFEWIQDGALTKFFSWAYRTYARSHTKNIYRQMVTVMSQRIDVPQTVVVVSTYIGMAHQLGAIKEKLMKDLDVRIILAVQVTDDSPQYVWYIQGADVIFVPSEHTKKQMLKYAREENLEPVKMIVNPYPVSPLLDELLSIGQFESRKMQLDPEYKGRLHISVPIPGAAVGTGFNATLMRELHRILNNALFHCVAKSAPFTQDFIAETTAHPYVDLRTATHDRTVVDEYEQIYRHEIIAMEITKPSEQAFKVLLEPHQRGGVIMLFTMPVGKQEYDNLDFMERHHLIPLLATHHRLYQCAIHNKPLEGELKEHVDIHAKHWRGLRLPADSNEAAIFVAWCLKEKIYSRMLLYTLQIQMKHNTYNPYELGSDGVARFWKHIEELL